MTTPKVSLYSLPDLKATLDDHLPIYLTSPNLLPTSSAPLPSSLRLTPSHTHTYIRLALGYTAVTIAIYLFYLDYYLKIPFSQHKHIAAPAALAYFTLNAALTAWIWLGERGIIFAGTRKGKAGTMTTLKLYSKSPKRKYAPTYTLLAEWTSGSQGKKEEVEVSAPFTRFFAKDGLFVPAAFEGWVRESIPVLAGQKVVGEQKAAGTESVLQQSQAEAVPVKSLEVEDDDIVVVNSPVMQGGQGSARDITPASASKRRPKKKA